MATINKLNEFIDLLETQVKNHSIYIWGAQGQDHRTLSEAWIKSKESGTHETNALKLYRRNCSLGYKKVMRAFDCSGLGVWTLQRIGLIRTDKDYAANDFKKKCTKLSKSQLKKGDWVFKVNGNGKATHIGYVVDNNLNVIESQGRAYGVVRRPLSAQKWNWYGRPDFFKDYISGSTTPTKTKKNHFYRNLKKGIKGDDVRELQRLLNKSKILTTNVLEDGVFGSGTDKAVRTYQTKKALKADGIAGKLTITKLGGIWG